jgi:hypothetical protein
MKLKEYPMDDKYKRALEFITAQIAERDEMRRQLKLLPPKDRLNALRTIDALDKKIEKGERALAKEYDATQNLRRLEVDRDTLLDEAMERMAGAYVHVKYRNPEMLAEMEEKINNMPPAEAKAFYEAAARHESGDLVKIIRRKGETLEEAEEFLKNYRRLAEEKRDSVFEDLHKTFAGAYVHAKYRHPEMLPELDEAIADMDAEQAKGFYEWVARHEAEDLIAMIARKGETPEQTEEFLKNYRAAASE